MLFIKRGLPLMTAAQEEKGSRSTQRCKLTVGRFCGQTGEMWLKKPDNFVDVVYGCPLTRGIYYLPSVQ